MTGQATSTSVFVSIGAWSSSDAVLVNGPAVEGDQVVRATVFLPATVLTGAPIDYAHLAYFQLGDQPGRETSFTGVVEDARPYESGLELRLASLTSRLQEQTIGGLACWPDIRVPYQSWGLELAWTLARAGGIPESQLDIPFARPNAEPFVVMIPVGGLAAGHNFQLGRVRFVDAPTLKKLALQVGEDYLRNIVADSEVFAEVEAWARTAFDAELRGRAIIADALRWLVVRFGYSTSHLPDGQLTTFRRAWKRARPVARPLVVVRGKLTRRGYVRGTDDTEVRPTLDTEDARLVESPPLPEETSTEERAAMRFLYEAAHSDDIVAEIMLMATALEFYISGASVPPHFTVEELKVIRQRATEGLSPQKASRLNDVLAMANDPSFGLRLATMCDQDGVVLMPEERQILRRMRAARNDLVHGKGITEPTSQELDSCLALIRRMLVHRVARRAATR